MRGCKCEEYLHFYREKQRTGRRIQNLALNPTISVRTTRAESVKVEVNPNMTSVPASIRLPIKDQDRLYGKDIRAITVIFRLKQGSQPNKERIDYDQRQSVKNTARNRFDP